MKTTIYQFAFIGLLWLTGCTSEDTFRHSDGQGNHSLVAVIEREETTTRTAVDESGNVTWITTDEIGVFGTQTTNAMFTSTGNGANVIFKGDLQSDTEDIKWAYYPYNANAIVNGSSLTFTLPSEYTYTGNSNAPMIGFKDESGNNFTFKHLCGLLHMTLGGGIPLGADRFVITSVAADGNAPTPAAIAGQVQVVDINAKNAVLTISEGDSKKTSITYKFASINPHEEFQNFFVPLPVGQYAKLEVAFYVKDETTPKFVRTISNLNVQRAKMISMPILDWKTGQQYVLNANTKEITEDLTDKVAASLENNTTLTYASGIDEADIPEVGNVVWARVTDNFPNGFLGKVAGVQRNSDGSYSVTTEVAALSEAFDELYIDEAITLEKKGAVGRGIKDELEGFQISTEMQLNLGEKGSPIYAYGKAKLGGELCINLQLDKKKKVNNAMFTFVTTVELELGMELKIETPESKKEFPLKEIPLKSIPLGGGVIQIVPTIKPVFFITPNGSFENNMGLSYTFKNFAGAQCKDGVWIKGSNNPKSSNKSPWNFEGGLSINGEIKEGLSIQLNGKFYGRDDVKFYVAPQFGAKVGGVIEVNAGNAESLEKILREAKLQTSLFVGAEIGIDASLFVPGEELNPKFESEPMEFLKKELPILPFFEDLLAEITAKEHVNDYQAKISTDMNGELASKDTKISIVVKDANDEIIKESEQITYTGGPSKEIMVGPEDTPQEPESVPLMTELEDLKTDETYTAYPVIQSPLLEDILPEGKLELRSLAITFQASGDLREQLIQMYKETGGDNWYNKHNWCSDQPIEYWYGIYKDENGNYQINLHGNNLKGTFSLSDKQISSISIAGNEDLKNINVSGCTTLEKLDYDIRFVTSLNVSECDMLVSDDFFYQKVSSQYTTDGLSVFIARNCSNLTNLNLHNKSLEMLDVSGCSNLCDFSFYYDQGKRIRHLNISNCQQIADETLYNLLEPLKSSAYTVDVLDISGCTQIKQLPNSIKELYAKGCPLLTEIGSNSTSTSPVLEKCVVDNCMNLKIINLSGSQMDSLSVNGCVNLEYLNCHQTSLSNINVTTCSNLKELSCSGNQLSHIDVSHNKNLTTLNCSDNQLSLLDISNNKELNSLYCDNNNLPDLNLKNLTNLELLSCDYNQLTTLDVTSCLALKQLNVYGNNLSLLNAEGCTKLTSLICLYNKTPLSINLRDCKALTFVNCEQSQVKSLDASRCIKLTNLRCGNNPLETLNISGCHALQSLDVREGQLKSLTAAGCVTLKTLYCYQNQLETLSVSGCTALETLYCYQNQIQSLNLDDCPNLKMLNCYSNKLSVLDTHKCEKLNTLDCSQNRITKLNVDGCTSLADLGCSNNWFSSLKIACDKLENLDCSNNDKLTTLDLSGCINLKDLRCTSTSLASLDMSSCSLFEWLECQDNQSLTSLHLGNNEKPLKRLYCYNTIIKQEFPTWFSKKPSFELWCDYRYNYAYREVGNSGIWEYESENEYGWWYSDEPEVFPGVR